MVGGGIVFSHEFAKHLEAAGVVEDLSTVLRIVVDIKAGQRVKVHVVRIGDEKLLDVDWSVVTDRADEPGAPVVVDDVEPVVSHESE